MSFSRNAPAEVTTDLIRDHGSHQLLRTAAGKEADGSIWAEFGVCQGNSTSTLLQTLPDDGRFHLFDSLKGLPEPWRLTDSMIEPAGRWSSQGQWPRFVELDRRCSLHAGWFEDTLPFDFDGPLGLVHIDSDLYSSCRTVLEAIAPYLVEGTVMIFDELVDASGNYTRWREGEWRALQESGINIDWRGIALNAMWGTVVIGDAKDLWARGRATGVSRL